MLEGITRLRHTIVCKVAEADAFIEALSLSGEVESHDELKLSAKILRVVGDENGSRARAVAHAIVLNPGVDAEFTRATRVMQITEAYGGANMDALGLMIQALFPTKLPMTIEYEIERESEVPDLMVAVIERDQITMGRRAA